MLIKPYEFIKYDAEHVPLSEDPALREAIFRAAREMIPYCNRLSKMGVLASYPNGSNGNVSKRAGDGFVITASQLPSKYNMKPEDFVFVRYDIFTNKARYSNIGDDPTLPKRRKPSSETPLHGGVYFDLDVNAIVHGHELIELVYSERALLAWNQLGIVETASLKDLEGTIVVSEKVLEALEDLPGLEISDYYVILKDHHYPDGYVGFATFGYNLEQAYEKARNVNRALRILQI